MIRIFLICLLLVSCASVDMDKQVTDNGVGGLEKPLPPPPPAAQPPVSPDIVFVERPVFVPQAEAPPRAPPTGRQAVNAANESGIIRPQDYSHAAMVYDYHPDMVYEAYAQPLRVTDICLEPGEIALEAPFVSDSERWILGGGVSHEQGMAVQHIYVKPESSGFSASLIINTNRRVYRIILRSYGDIHMPLVRWRYFTGLPQTFMEPPPPPLPDDTNNESPPSLDPRFMSFNYRVTYSLFGKPYWLPDLVFDDGSKTYIRFPAQVLQREIPAVYENRKDILNYRVIDNVIVIDKLTETLTVKIERKEITIRKKKG